MSSSSMRTPARMLFAIACLAPAGCNQTIENCESVGGMYEAQYVALSGDCGPITNPHRVPFDGGNSGVNTTMQTLSTARVVTEIVMTGCTARMTQTVEQGTVIRSRIHGSPINIQNQHELTGIVDVMRFDETGQISCSGLYNAVFTKRTVTIGAAAR
jgi:hypothetical protein